MRSKVTVGNGAEAESDAKLGELIIPSGLIIDPERSMDAAADVVDAIDTAAGGSGWL